MGVAKLALVLLGLLVVNVESQCTNNAVRLVWGQGPFEGNVQICINGVWGWVCDNGWSTVDAGVVCTQIGYSATGALYRMWSYYGLANLSAPVHLDNIDCTGTESRLIDCPRLYPVGVTFCGLNEVAGVVCPSGGTCTNGNIRMIRNSNGTPLRNQGRVEVCHNSQWGTVCDDYWGTNDAKVACYQLGYSKTGAYRYLYAAFGQGYGPIYLDNVQCTSSETSLFSCTANAIGSHNCGHNEDAGVRCNGQITSSCTNGDVKLWRPYGGIGPEYFGLALYCKNNAWIGVCDDSYTCHTARLFCQQLGYPGAMLKRDRTFWGYYNGIDHYAWSCSSSHTSLSQCTYYYHSNCNSYHWDQMGFSCYPNIQGTSCTNGDVRLVNGTSKFNGRVEYCFEGEWAPLCSLSTYAASLLCKQMGFTSTYALRLYDERFGVGNARSGLNYLSCSSSATSLSQCNAVRKGQGGCYLYIGRCNTEMGLHCYNNTGACVDGSIRLVNGTIQQEGKIEVCSQGIWGSVCPYQWNSIDAYIVCKQLGYTGTGPLSYFNSYFGNGDVPGIFGYVRCYGWENSIFDCTKVTFPFATCNPLTSNIGIVCKEGCNNGDVRLIGGGFENEGTVQVCYGNLWGLISDNNWNDNNARVVCNQLGYTGGNAISVLGSQYGKPNMTIHLKSVSCTGTELSIDDCTKTQLSVNNGKKELAIAEAAGVDCIYDVPTDPPCISYNSSIVGGSECHPNGKVMLLNNILQFCYNGYWSPYCKDISPTTASVACNQLGYTQYKWASVFESTEYDASRNFSLFYTINCNGSENSLSQCNIIVNPDCTPYCRMGKKMLRCFNPTVCNTNGAIRLADGIIENEGRVEICVNNVWGSICSNGWDVTDAHVVCTQLGHPELKPIIFNNSEFGSGIYPIVYSNSACGGWESSFTDCNKQVYPLSNCSRSNVAGVLCGYDCQDGDVRLVGSQWNYEGTVQICYKNLWGLVSDSGWTQTDAEVICQQLGYEPTGSIAVAGSQYGKPDFTIHYSNVDCVGNEALITDCTYITYSLQQGKNMLPQTNVAGVKCYTPDQCVPPPTSGGDCSSGMVRFSSGQTGIPEGNLEYCYNGFWSPFCYLGPNEAIVACRQLGYTDYELAVTFNDGRFDNSSSSATSLFQNISCNDPSSVSTLSQCTMLDSCQSTCDYAVGLRCYETTNCVEGDVRLVGGNFDTEGRVEVCHNNIWGTVCGTGFTTTDAYVVCKELGLGTSEPTIYTNSFFGDGDASIIFSEVKCKGFEQSIVNCPRTEYGSFTCSRDNVVGITCQDSCTNGDIRLVDGSTDMEGTILICDENTWGLIADADWDNNDAQVVCTVLGYSRGGMAVLGSQYSKPNKTILFNNFDCTGSEASLDLCGSVVIDPDTGRSLYSHVNVAGVKCLPDLPTTLGAVSSTGAYAGVGIVIVLLVISILFTISMILYVAIIRARVKKTHLMNQPKVQMSGLGIENPMAGFDDEDGTGGFDTAEQNDLVKKLEEQ